MPAESGRKDTQKVMASDLIRIFEEYPEQTYTAADLKS